MPSWGVSDHPFWLSPSCQSLLMRRTFIFNFSLWAAAIFSLFILFHSVLYIFSNRFLCSDSWFDSLSPSNTIRSKCVEINKKAIISSYCLRITWRPRCKCPLRCRPSSREGANWRAVATARFVRVPNYKRDAALLHCFLDNFGWPGTSPCFPLKHWQEVEDQNCHRNK